MDILVEHGLYKIKNLYFSHFQSKHWFDSKNGNRPYYYAIKGHQDIVWLIPISSQVENYKNKISKIEAKRGVGNCLYYHIGIIAGQERVFLIGDMLPIIHKYIESAFTIKGIEYVIRDKELNAALYSKSMRFLHLIHSKQIHSRTNILQIESELLHRP